MYTTPHRSPHGKASTQGGRVRTHTPWEIPEHEGAEAKGQNHGQGPPCISG